MKNIHKSREKNKNDAKSASNQWKMVHNSTQMERPQAQHQCHLFLSKQHLSHACVNEPSQNSRSTGATDHFRLCTRSPAATCKILQVGLSSSSQRGPSHLTRQVKASQCLEPTGIITSLRMGGIIPTLTWLSNAYIRATQKVQ